MEYQFDCECPKCRKITKYFGLKSKQEAKRLGYQLTESRKCN